MKKDRHPTKRQVQRVIDNLTKALKASRKIERKNPNGSSVSMLHAGIDNNTVESYLKPELNICGTPLCHGGWYYVVAKPKKSLFLEIGKGDKVLNRLNCDFHHGSLLMAHHLGFKKTSELENWASNNPKIWGNVHGCTMFFREIAFNYNGALTLSKIITHWKRVQKRLPK